MNPHLVRDIAALKRSLAEIGGMAESQIEKAMQSFIQRDEALAKTISKGDKLVDELEVEIEEAALKTLALYQPRASDLRFLVTALKVNGEIERAADFGKNIAQRAKIMAQNDVLVVPAALEDMSKRAQAMLAKSLDALLNLDSLLAKELRVEDDIVDDLNREVFEWVKTQINEHLDWLEPLLSVASVSQALERIADIATNIAEDTIYLVEGYIARHTKPELAPLS